MQSTRFRRSGGRRLLPALLALPLLALSPTAARAQTGTVVGEVVDGASNQPINGAQVSIDRTNRGGLTDGRGRFSIPGVAAGTYTVRVQYIGYQTAEQQVTVAAGQTAQLRFALGVSAITLNEVVVTGTAGAVERRKLGTSVGSVNVSQVQELVPVASVGQALQARLPGVRSVGTAGGVGASRDLRIRGTSSFQLGQRPVIYIDGIRVDNKATEWGAMGGATCCSFSGGAGEDRLSDLNPDDIDRVEVLKGAAAATLYGAEATNGVIQIFTKKGRGSSKPQFTFASNVGFNRHRANFATKLNPRFRGPDGFQALDANETLIENGLINSYDLSVQGGGEDVTYFVSGSYGFEDGSVKPNWQKKGNVRMNLTWLASEHWSFDLNTAFAKNNILALQSGNNWTSLLGNAVLGNPKKATAERPYGEPWVSVPDVQAMEAFSNAVRWTGSIAATFRPSERFMQKVTLGFDNVNDQKARHLPFGHYYTYLGTVGERNIGYRRATNATFDYLGNLSFNARSSITSDLSFGAQGYWETEALSMAIGRGYAGPGVTTVGGAANTYGDESFRETIKVGAFAQNRFSIKDKFFVTGGVRVDGHSAFGVNYGLQPFPKADVAYLLSEEGFLPEFISNFKVRAAVGTSGLSPGAYDQFQTYNPTAVLGDVPGVTPANPGNPELAPEKTMEFEAGFDLGLFRDRLGVEFTTYRATTRDALLNVPLPPSEGFSQAQLRNVGKILNQGWEVAVTAAPIVGSGYRWTTQLNLDGSKNEVLDLGPTAVAGRLGNYRVGYPVIGVWGYKATAYDAQKIRHTRSDTTVYWGPSLPTFNASFGNTFNLQRFTFYAQLSMEKGAWFGNGDRAFRIRQGAGDELHSTYDFSNSDEPVPTVKTDSLVNYFTLVDAYDQRDNVRLREVSVSYSLPDALLGRLGLRRTTVTLAGQNLYWWDDCNCADPNMTYEAGSSFGVTSGFLAMPQPRRFLLSVRTSF